MSNNEIISLITQMIDSVPNIRNGNIPLVLCVHKTDGRIEVLDLCGIGLIETKSFLERLLYSMNISEPGTRKVVNTDVSEFPFKSLDQ